MPEENGFQTDRLEEARPSTVPEKNLLPEKPLVHEQTLTPEQTLVPEQTMLVDEEPVSTNQHPTSGGNRPGFLELVYGVLFEPRGAMVRVAEQTPTGIAALVVAILSLVGTIMFYITIKQVLSDNGQGWFFPAAVFLPVAAILSLFFSFFKWFLYSAVLHLTADLLGGRGSARAVFAVVGLSGLPALFMVPFQLLAFLFFPRSSAVDILLILAALALAVWSLILAVIGMKAAHGISTGRALLAALAPVLAVVAAVLVALVSLALLLATMPAKFLPGYF